MYEVQNRTVSEHELYSFEIERENLKWVYAANLEHVAETNRTNVLDQIADHSRLGKDEIFRRRALNPKRLKGVGAFATAFGLANYAPYLAVYLGTTAPLLGAVVAGVYGMMSFSETQIVNNIKIVKDGSENHGKLDINVGLSAFATTNIIVDPKDVLSICSLGGDDLGVDNVDGNVISINRYFDKNNNVWINEQRALTLPGDAFRDRAFLDWVLADKSGESVIADDF